MASAFGNGTTLRGISTGAAPRARFGFDVLTDSAGSGFNFDSKKAQLTQFCKTFDFNSPPKGEKVLELVALLEEFAKANEKYSSFTFKTEKDAGKAIITVSGEKFSANVQLSCNDAGGDHFTVSVQTKSLTFTGTPANSGFSDAIELLAGMLFNHSPKAKNGGVREGEVFVETE